ncbi:MAG: ATP-binding cassette domain-containing protein, partial [Nitrososphaerota archaeon]
MKEKILTIKELRAGYGKVEVLKGINLEVDKGEKIVVIGPSGSGKSTLLKCIPMLIKPWSGEIIFNGKVVTNDPSSLKEIRTKIGFVFQQYSLFPHMNLLRNVALPLELGKGLKKKDAENIALSILSRLGLSDLAFKYPLELSGGQQQRAAIARALAIDPILLLLD